MKTLIKTPFAAVVGAAFLSGFAVTANAESNPFGMTELSSGYMQLAEASADKSAEMACGAAMGMEKPKVAEGACAGNKPATAEAAKAGEGKCGAMMDGDKMKKGMEGMCGEMMKGKEGACGAMPAGEKMKEGACGGAMKMPEGKCGDQCGEAMKNCPDAKAKEGACGANMKGCGEGMQGCGDMMKGGEGACAANMKAPETAKAPATTTKSPEGIKIIPPKK